MVLGDLYAKTLHEISSDSDLGIYSIEGSYEPRYSRF